MIHSFTSKISEPVNRGRAGNAFGGLLTHIEAPPPHFCRYAHLLVKERYTMESRLEEFLVLFVKLKKETNDAPSNLRWLPEQKPYLSKLCYDLDACGTAILRHLSKKNTKHTIAPDIFSRDWEEYLESWKLE